MCSIVKNVNSTILRAQTWFICLAVKAKLMVGVELCTPYWLAFKSKFKPRCEMHCMITISRYDDTRAALNEKSVNRKLTLYRYRDKFIRNTNDFRQSNLEKNKLISFTLIIIVKFLVTIILYITYSYQLVLQFSHKLIVKNKVQWQAPIGL